MTNQANRNCVTFGATLRHDGEGDGIMLRYIYVLFVLVVTRDIAIAIHIGGRNTVPDKSKIKNDITELWILLYSHRRAIAFFLLPFTSFCGSFCEKYRD